MDLREKLRLALAAAPVRSAATLSRPAAPHPGPATASLPVVRRQTGLGEVYLCEERWPLQHRHGHFALGEALGVGTEALARLAPGLGTEELERAAFVDIETTGLAGGTGTLAFLVGIATFERGGLCLRQYFLANIGREEAMLAVIADLLTGCSAVVTFNGRCFDIPFLESRFVLSRLRPPFQALAHIDLLLASRRLYRERLDSCRLSAVEEAVLGVRRERDVPGWLIPRLYFDYLRYGAAGPLVDVFRHNRLDVLSLVTLLARTGQLLSDYTPEDPGHCLALARWDEAQGRLAQASELYRSVLGTTRAGADRAFALQRLLRIERRSGSWDGMEQLLREALQRDAATENRISLLVEMAKLKEHRRRDYSAAESFTREAIALREILPSWPGAPPPHMRDHLEKRLSRLLRRQGRQRTLDRPDSRRPRHLDDRQREAGILSGGALGSRMSRTSS